MPAPAAAATPSSRAAAGKKLRKKAPRTSHADWAAGPDRPDPVETLTAQDASRVPELVPIRHGRMLVSPFTFFRGAAAIMAADLATTPSPGLGVQLCGDAHLSNFGVFAAPDRRLVFDVNDFDETLPGPFEWDVKRLAASIAIAGRDRGFDAAERTHAVVDAVEEYRAAMRRFAAMRDLDVWYARLDVEGALDKFQHTLTPGERKKIEKTVDKAKQKDSLRALDRLTERIDGKLRIAADPPLIVPIEQLLSLIHI